MILKFCYQNEIHRSSDAPTEFGHLRVFLKSMFRDALPKNYSLTYVTNEGQSVLLNTEEAYESLKAIAATKAIKVVIAAEESEPQVEKVIPEEKAIHMEVSDYDIIAHPVEVQKEEEPVKEEIPPKVEPVERAEPVEERKIEQVVDVLAKVSEEITHAYVLPMLQTLDAQLPETALISSIVQEKLRAQMPILLAQVRETVLKHSNPVHGAPSQKISYPKLDGPMPSNQVEIEEEVIYQGQNAQNAEEKQDLVGKVIQVINDLPDKAMKVLNDLPDKAQKAFNDFPEKAQKAFNDFPEKAQKAFNDFPEVASKALNELPKVINELPDKAANFADTVVHQISGDPYVEMLEGRYPKSVVEKARQLKEFFPESERKELLDFVSKFPKEISLDEIAHHYANTKGM